MVLSALYYLCARQLINPLIMKILCSLLSLLLVQMGQIPTNEDGRMIICFLIEQLQCCCYNKLGGQRFPLFCVVVQLRFAHFWCGDNGVEPRQQYQQTKQQTTSAYIEARRGGPAQAPELVKSGCSTTSSQRKCRERCWRRQI